MRAIVFLAFILIGCVFSNAQAQTYKINKQNYDYKMYVPQPSDPNNPTVMGVASFFVPGLGQMISGEVGRGLAFLGGTYAAFGIGYGLTATSRIEYGNRNDTQMWTGLGIMIGAVGLNIWSIVDAVKVAKVNNMYFQDLRSNLSLVKVELNPFLDTNDYLGQINASAGLSLKATF